MRRCTPQQSVPGSVNGSLQPLRQPWNWLLNSPVWAHLTSTKLGAFIRRSFSSRYYRDHAPPHFHALYGEHEITVNIATGEVSGDFPKRALAHVQEWCTLHREELTNTWTLARANKPLQRIDPLE